jgi:DNA-binding transcriptional ArsR family regulator
MNSRTTRPPRFETIDVRGLSDDVRRAILKRVKAKLGFNEALSALDISRGALSYYLRGLRKTPDEVVSKAPQYLEERKFHEVVKGVDRLRAVGLVREDGSIDYSLVSQILALASRDEYLKQLMLRFVVDNFREELKKMLSLLPSTMRLSWGKGFEEFLTTREKGGRSWIRGP